MDSEKLFGTAADLARALVNKSNVVPLNRAQEIEELPLKIRVELLEELVEVLSKEIGPLRKQIEDLRLKIG